MSRRCLLDLAALTAIVAACLAGCSLQKDAAKTRVENVLAGLTKDDQSKEYQTAICQWYDGTYAMNQSDLESALNQFEAWQKQKSLRAPIQSFTVEKVVKQPGAPVPTAIAEVLIDGKPYKIKVAKDQSMEWQ